MLKGRIVEVRTDRFTVNVTKGRTRRWHVTGDWPDARYFLVDRHGKPVAKHNRFADKGDTVECVVLKTYTMDYHGLRWHRCRRTVERTIVVE